MARPIKPPLGVMPYRLWVESHPDPQLAELVERHGAVVAALRRYLDAGIKPDPLWRKELGLTEEGGHGA